METSSREIEKFRDERLENQLAKIERTRLVISLVVMVGLFTAAAIDSVVIGDQIEQVFQDMSDYYKILIGGQLLVAHLIFALIHINKRIKRNQGVLLGYKVFTTVVESIVPGITLLFLISTLKIPALIDSPVVFLYIPILLIQILHLDYRLILLSGAIISGTYALAINWALSLESPNEILNLPLPSAIYYLRSIIFLIAAGCASFVSHRFRKLLESRVKYQSERNQMEQLFSQQVSRQVVDALVENQDVSSRQEVTVLFLDIRGFTNFAQDKEPEEVIAFQNKFFSPLIDIINKHHGITNQIMGDGLMATFGAPVKIDQHQAVAFQAAMEIFDHVNQFEEVDIGMGMHCGEVVTGNIGNHNRKQFSVSGTTVIIAARLEQLNKDYDSHFLVSKEFFDGVSSSVDQWTNLGKQQLKGIDKAIEIIKIQ